MCFCRISKKTHACCFGTALRHGSPKVTAFLKNYPKIFIGTIIGGTTDFAQPLDLGINRKFKAACRRKALNYTNTVIEAMSSEGLREIPRPSETLLKSR